MPSSGPVCWQLGATILLDFATRNASCQAPSPATVLMNSSSPIIWNKLAHQPTDLRQHVRLKLYTRFLLRKITVLDPRPLYVGDRHPNLTWLDPRMFKDSSLGFSGSPKCYRLTIPVVPGLVRLSVGLPVTDPIATLYQESCIPNPPPFFSFLMLLFLPFLLLGARSPQRSTQIVVAVAQPGTPRKWKCYHVPRINRSVNSFHVGRLLLRSPSGSFSLGTTM